MLILTCVLPPFAHADYEAGAGAYRTGDSRRALAELVPAADHDARAALLLADMFERGSGVERDAQQALMWRRRAAGLGHAGAQLALGRQYLRGAGVPAQPREAAAWFERAAQQGDPDARFELGRMLLDGRAIAADAARGRALIEQAAAAGSADARAWLGQPGGSGDTAIAEPQPSRATAPEAPATRVEPGDVRARPDVTWSWGMYRGWGSGAWYAFDLHPGWGAHGPGPYPWAWHPYGWYPYGHPGSGVQFGMRFSN